MAVVSRDQAVQLLNFYSPIFNEIQEFSKANGQSKTYIYKEFDSLKKDFIFAHLASAYLKNETFSDDPTRLNDFITKLYYIKHYDSLLKQLKNDYDAYFQSIKAHAKNVLLAKSRLASLFLRKEKKAKISESYDFLINNKQKTKDIINSFKNQIEDLSSTSLTKAKNDLSNYGNEYYDFLVEIDKNAFVSKGTINASTVAIERCNNVLETASKLKEAPTITESDIKYNVEKLLAYEILNTLKTIPVEELNRDKAGIRIKALKDRGLFTIGDLYSKNVYQLASINGISEDTAYTIDHRVKQFAQGVAKQQKIRLTVDDKNKYSTPIVKSIYRYKWINENVAYIRKDNFADEVNKNIELLDSIGKCSAWLFYSDRFKSSIKEAYVQLSEFYTSELSVLIINTDRYLKKAIDVNVDDAWNDFGKNSVEYYKILENIYPGLIGNSDAFYGLPEELANQIEEECIFPDGLNCSLRRYQEWGVKYILHQKKVLLGDEMGLGKTVQAIATMVSLKNTQATHFIVVCPASVLTNWCREIAKHSKLRYIMVHGPNKKSMFRYWLHSGGVAVTTYDSSSVFNFNSPDYHYDLLVVDEAHYVKNPQAFRSQRVRALCDHTDRILFMTGTALENRVDEMIMLVSLLNINVASKIQRLAYLSTAPQFREVVAPVYYRRKREDVLTELPDKIETQEWCELLPEEEHEYECAILSKQYMTARRLSWNIDDLRYSSKARRLLEIIEDAKNDDRKILVFSFFLETISKIKNMLGDICLNPINGSISPKRRQEIIDEFDAAPAGTVLCAQIQSGGTGLNIQAASVVIICEPQLKPSIENQAISRAYRMGQTRKVQVFRLLCTNTIDERITDLLEEKQAIFDVFADKSVAAEKTKDIDETTFGKIIESEIERIKQEKGITSDKDLEEFTNKKVKDGSYVVSVSQTSAPSYNSQKHSAEENNDSIDVDEDNHDYTLNKTNDYPNELKMSYSELTEFLAKKYGKAKGDYFLTPSCKSKNPNISRMSEGLFIHHIDEDKAIRLSDKNYALEQPFEYQKADRLIYCDILEHLILHIKIIELGENGTQSMGGIRLITGEINDCYNNLQSESRVLEIVKDSVRNKIEDYVKILLRLYDDLCASGVAPTFEGFKSLFSKGIMTQECEKVKEALDSAKADNK